MVDVHQGQEECSVQVPRLWSKILESNSAYIPKIAA